MFTASQVQTGWGTGHPVGPPAFSGSYDKNFVMEFNITDTVTVAHNLQKYPAVTVVNSAKDEVDGEVTYLDLNNLIVKFSAPFSGTVFCN